MSVLSTDLVVYGSTNRPEDDTTTVGGAIVLTARPLDAQFSSAARPEIDSTNAGDTMNVTITGRLADGSVTQEVKALNGTTAVLFDTTFERIQKVVIASAAAGTVTVAQGTGGTVRHTFAPGELAAFIMFINSASDVAQTVRYEKCFWRNNNATNALLTAEVTLTDDPSSVLRIALASATGDTTSAANRLTEPGSISSWADDDVAIAVPGTNLGTTTAIGFWLEMTLAAENAALKSSGTVQLAGFTT